MFDKNLLSRNLHDTWEEVQDSDCLLAETWYEQTFMREREYEPTFEDIKKLRGEIVLGSLYYSDYENSLDFDEHEVCAFFDGYLDFLQGNYEEEHDGEYPEDVFELESDEELEAWLDCWLCGVGSFTQYYTETIEIEDEDEEAA